MVNLENLYWISSGKKTWFYNIGKYLEKLTQTANIVSTKNPLHIHKKVDVGNFVTDNSKLKSIRLES